MDGRMRAQPKTARTICSSLKTLSRTTQFLFTTASKERVRAAKQLSASVQLVTSIDSRTQECRTCPTFGCPPPRLKS
eukprot:9235831-Pyramimonas_sp.AAC.1